MFYSHCNKYDSNSEASSTILLKLNPTNILCFSSDATRMVLISIN